MYIDFAKLKKSPHNGNDAYRLHYVLRSTRVCTYSTCIMVSSATCSLLALSLRELINKSSLVD